MDRLAAEKPYRRARPVLWPHQPKLPRRCWPTARNAFRSAAAAVPGAGVAAALVRDVDGSAEDASKALSGVEAGAVAP
jgi:hypothetical protein